MALRGPAELAAPFLTRLLAWADRTVWHPSQRKARPLAPHEALPRVHPALEIFFDDRGAAGGDARRQLLGARGEAPPPPLLMAAGFDGTLPPAAFGGAGAAAAADYGGPDALLGTGGGQGEGVGWGSGWARAGAGDSSQWRGRAAAGGLAAASAGPLARLPDDLYGPTGGAPLPAAPAVPPLEVERCDEFGLGGAEGAERDVNATRGFVLGECVMVPQAGGGKPVTAVIERVPKGANATRAPQLGEFFVVRYADGRLDGVDGTALAPAEAKWRASGRSPRPLSGKRRDAYARGAAWDGVTVTGARVIVAQGGGAPPARGVILKAGVKLGAKGQRDRGLQVAYEPGTASAKAGTVAVERVMGLDDTFELPYGASGRFAAALGALAAAMAAAAAADAEKRVRARSPLVAAQAVARMQQLSRAGKDKGARARLFAAERAGLSPPQEWAPAEGVAVTVAPSSPSQRSAIASPRGGPPSVPPLSPRSPGSGLLAVAEFAGVVLGTEGVPPKPVMLRVSQAALRMHSAESDAELVTLPLRTLTRCYAAPIPEGQVHPEGQPDDANSCCVIRFVMGASTQQRALVVAMPSEKIATAAVAYITGLLDRRSVEEEAKSPLAAEAAPDRPPTASAPIAPTQAPGDTPPVPRPLSVASSPRRNTEAGIRRVSPAPAKHAAVVPSEPLSPPASSPARQEAQPKPLLSPLGRLPSFKLMSALDELGEDEVSRLLSESGASVTAADGVGMGVDYLGAAELQQLALKVAPDLTVAELEAVTRAFTVAREFMAADGQPARGGARARSGIAGRRGWEIVRAAVALRVLVTKFQSTRRTLQDLFDFFARERSPEMTKRELVEVYRSLSPDAPVADAAAAADAIFAVAATSGFAPGITMAQLQAAMDKAEHASDKLHTHPAVADGSVATDATGNARVDAPEVGGRIEPAAPATAPASAAPATSPLTMRPRAKTEAFFPALLMGPSQSVSVLLRFLDNELDIVSADELDTCIASIYYEEIVACASGRQRLPPNEGPVERLDIRFTPTDEPITQTREVRFMVNSATACRECRRLLNERCEAAREEIAAEAAEATATDTDAPPQGNMQSPRKFGSFTPTPVAHVAPRRRSSADSADSSIFDEEGGGSDKGRQANGASEAAASVPPASEQAGSPDGTASALSGLLGFQLSDLAAQQRSGADTDAEAAQASSQPPPIEIVEDAADTAVAVAAHAAVAPAHKTVAFASAPTLAEAPVNTESGQLKEAREQAAPGAAAPVLSRQRSQSTVLESSAMLTTPDADSVPLAVRVLLNEERICVDAEDDDQNPNALSIDLHRSVIHRFSSGNLRSAANAGPPERLDVRYYIAPTAEPEGPVSPMSAEATQPALGEIRLQLPNVHICNAAMELLAQGRRGGRKSGDGAGRVRFMGEGGEEEALPVPEEPAVERPEMAQTRPMARSLHGRASVRVPRHASHTPPTTTRQVSHTQPQAGAGTDREGEAAAADAAQADSPVTGLMDTVEEPEVACAAPVASAAPLVSVDAPAQTWAQARATAAIPQQVQRQAPAQAQAQAQAPASGIAPAAAQTVAAAAAGAKPQAAQAQSTSAPIDNLLSHVRAARAEMRASRAVQGAMAPPSPLHAQAAQAAAGGDSSQSSTALAARRILEYKARVRERQTAVAVAERRDAARRHERRERRHAEGLLLTLQQHAHGVGAAAQGAHEGQAKAHEPQGQADLAAAELVSVATAAALKAVSAASSTAPVSAAALAAASLAAPASTTPAPAPALAATSSVPSLPRPSPSAAEKLAALARQTHSQMPHGGQPTPEAAARAVRLVAPDSTVGSGSGGGALEAHVFDSGHLACMTPSLAEGADEPTLPTPTSAVASDPLVAWGTQSKAVATERRRELVSLLASADADKAQLQEALMAQAERETRELRERLERAAKAGQERRGQEQQRAIAAAKVRAEAEAAAQAQAAQMAHAQAVAQAKADAQAFAQAAHAQAQAAALAEAQAHARAVADAQAHAHAVAEAQAIANEAQALAAGASAASIGTAAAISPAPLESIGITARSAALAAPGMAHFPLAATASGQRYGLGAGLVPAPPPSAAPVAGNTPAATVMRAPGLDAAPMPGVALGVPMAHPRVLSGMGVGAAGAPHLPGAFSTHGAAHWSTAAASVPPAAVHVPTLGLAARPHVQQVSVVAAAERLAKGVAARMAQGNAAAAELAIGAPATAAAISQPPVTETVPSAVMPTPASPAAIALAGALAAAAAQQPMASAAPSAPAVGLPSMALMPSPPATHVVPPSATPLSPAISPAAAQALPGPGPLMPAPAPASPAVAAAASEALQAMGATFETPRRHGIVSNGTSPEAPSSDTGFFVAPASAKATKTPRIASRGTSRRTPGGATPASSGGRRVSPSSARTAGGGFDMRTPSTHSPPLRRHSPHSSPKPSPSRSSGRPKSPSAVALADLLAKFAAIEAEAMRELERNHLPACRRLLDEACAFLAQAQQRAKVGAGTPEDVREQIAASRRLVVRYKVATALLVGIQVRGEALGGTDDDNVDAGRAMLSRRLAAMAHTLREQHAIVCVRTAVKVCVADGDLVGALSPVRGLLALAPPQHRAQLVALEAFCLEGLMASPRGEIERMATEAVRDAALFCCLSLRRLESDAPCTRCGACGACFVLGGVAAPRNPIAALADYAAASHARLVDVFEHFDRDRDGSLNADELLALLLQVRPESTPAELRYFQLMVDADGDGSVTLAELRAALAECKDVVGHGSVEAVDVLRRLAESMLPTAVPGGSKRGSADALRALFASFDGDSDGYLDAAELRALARSVLPGLSARELRHVMHGMAQVDSDGDGRVSCAELEAALCEVSPRLALAVAAGDRGKHRFVPRREGRRGSFFGTYNADEARALRRAKSKAPVTGFVAPGGAGESHLLTCVLCHSRELHEAPQPAPL